MKKRVWILLLCLALVLTACGKDKTNQTEKDPGKEVSEKVEDSEEKETSQKKPEEKLDEKDQDKPEEGEKDDSKDQPKEQGEKPQEEKPQETKPQETKPQEENPPKEEPQKEEPKEWNPMGEPEVLSRHELIGNTSWTEEEFNGMIKDYVKARVIYDAEHQPDADVDLLMREAQDKVDEAWTKDLKVKMYEDESLLVDVQIPDVSGSVDWITETIDLYHHYVYTMMINAPAGAQIIKFDSIPQKYIDQNVLQAKIVRNQKGETLLFCSTRPDQKVRIVSGQMDEDFYFVEDEVLYDDVLNEGQVILLKEVLSETMPGMMLTAEDGQQVVSLPLVYDMMYGNIPVRYYSANTN